MTDHARKYGEKNSYRIPVWNGLLEPRHLKRIGPALAMFLWFVDRTTMEKDGIGTVLRGMPVTTVVLAQSLGCSERNARRVLKRLAKEGYIERTRTPRGYSVRVVNSCKFGGSDRTGLSFQKPSDRTNTPCDRTKQADAIRQSSDKAKSVGCLPDAPFWLEMGIDTDRLPRGIVRLCEGLHATKGNQSPVEFLSACMDAIQGMGWRIPRQLAQAKGELRASNISPSPGQMQDLVAIPWAVASAVRH
jgi:hypothetical protein